MSILVTGGAGFIGFHVVKKLIKENNTVVIIDNLCDYYYPVYNKLERLSLLGFYYSDYKENNIYINSNNTVSFIKADLEYTEQYENLLSKFNIDYVIHLGASASVPFSIKYPNVYIHDIMAFYNILNYSINNNVKNFVFASSSSVYGKNNSVPFLEEQSITSPASIYAASKVCDEIIAKTISSIQNVPITALRFFTVYGPYGRPDMAIHKFTKSIINETPITINGDGTVRRAYTYIEDVVESIYRAIFNPQIGFNAFNVGNEESVSLLEIIHYLEEIIGKKAIIELKESLNVDMPVTMTTMNKFFSVFNYKAFISTKEGLQRFTNWFISSKQQNN